MTRKRFDEFVLRYMGLDKNPNQIVELPNMDFAWAAWQEALAQNTEMKVVGSIHRAHLKNKEERWCKEILMYSPDNGGDGPQHRVAIYTAKDVK